MGTLQADFRQSQLTPKPRTLDRGLGGTSLELLVSIAVLILLLSFADKSRLALSGQKKQKYRNGNIHRKLKVATSVISPQPKIQH